MAAKKKALRGFTLIELVIVIAVIAILAALLVPTILGQAEKARITRANSEIGELGKALARMRTQTGQSSGTGGTNCIDLKSLQCKDSGTSFTAPTSTTLCTANCGSIPLCSAPTTTADQLCWGGPYFNTPQANLADPTPLDPWGQKYTLSFNASTGAVTLTSTGPDKATGGSDDVVKTF